MQKKKINTTFFITLLAAIIFSALRTVLLYTNFDFTSGFFNVKLYATLFYLSLLVFCAFLYFAKNKYSSIKINKNTTANINTFFNIVLSLLFFGLAYTAFGAEEKITALERIAQYICVVSSVLSAISYAISAFLDNKFSKALKLAPVFYFISITILSFIKQTGFANTYNELSHILALIVLAFIVLEEGKCGIDKEFSPLLPVYFISSVLLSQSAIPDLVTLATGHSVFNLEIGILSAIKAVYFVFILIKIAVSIKTVREDMK